MAYNQQNETNKKDTNTRSNNLFNSKSSVEPVMVVTSFWNDMLKLVFHGQLPENQRTEKRQFDMENGMVTCVSREKCNELANRYEKELKPKLEDTTSAKEPFSVSVPIAGVNQLVLGISVTPEGEYRTYLELIKDIDPETLKSNHKYHFEFPMGEYIVNYNPDEGTFAERRLTHNGIDVFCKDLGDFRSASTKAYIHAARCVDRTYKDMLHGGIVAIAEKVGASIPTSQGYGNSRYGKPQGSIFDQSNNQPSMNIPTMSLDELESELAAAEGMAFT